MFSPEGPTARELAVQALSSVERGYDLLAPKFDHTPFRTPDAVLDAVGSVLERTGPYTDGLDLCCGTGAGLDVLRRVCRTSVTGVDFSAGMLAVARRRAGRAAEAGATGAGGSG
ncbi:methyltransferase domain-containing protein, partial [Streptomyces sp. SID625]|nr:methyltransferase domain-containing protein [Streptomyces sp. SID625]